MAEGWKKGEGPYSKSHPKMDRATDYTKRGIAAVSFGEPMTSADRTLMGAGSKLWAPASIKQGNSPGRNKGKDYGTSPNTKAAKVSGGSETKKYMAR